MSESGDAVTGVSEQRKIEAAQLQKVLRGELDWVVMKSLEKDRSRRYETATAFADDVQRFLDDETVAARPQSTGYRMQKFVRKHRGVVASLVTIAVLLVAGIAGTSWYAWEASQSAERERIARQEAQENEILARENEQLAKDRELEAKREAERANKATDIAEKKEAEARLQRKIAEERDRTSRAMVSFFEDDLLKFANPWNSILKETGAGEYSIREVLDAAASKFSPDPSELTMPADAYCSILLVIADTYEGLGEYEKTMEYVNGAYQIASKHFPKSNPIVIKTKLYVGFSKLLMSQRAEAINEFTDIYFLLAKLVEKAIDTEQGSLEKRIARTAMLTYLETLLQRFDYQVRTLPEWNEDSRIKLNWGLTRVFLMRSSFPKFIENATQLYGPDDDIVIYMKVAHGCLEFAFRDFDRSREIFEDVLVAAEKKHAVGEDGEDSVAMMGIKQVLTMAYTQLDRHPEKQVAFSESVFQSMERKFGINHPGTMGAVTFLINTLRRNDKQAEMVPYLKIQNRVHCQELGELHADSITVLENYAETLWNLKQERAAIDLLTERMQLIPDSPTGREIGESLVVTLYTMGQNAMKRKQPQLAVDCLLPTWQFEKTIFPNSWSTFDTQSLLGAAQYENGEIKTAITNMLQGCEGLQTRRESLPKDETFYRDSVERLVKYYEKENDEPNAILWQKALKEIK